MTPRPLTVLGGYLGAGKTTLLNAFLARPDAQPTGVLVNDFGAINVDADLIRNRSGATLELANGCVCCSIAGDLGVALEDMRSLDVSQVIIEASGVAQPGRIADYGHSAPGYRLGAVLTVVDAQALPELRRNRYVSSLIAAQLDQADLLLVTKLDLLDSSAHAAFLQSLPRPAIATNRSRATDVLLEPELHSNPRRSGHGRRGHSPSSGADPTFESVSIQTERAVDQQALARFLDDLPPTVLRMKGWITDESSRPWLLQRVGRRWQLEPAPSLSFRGCRLVMIAPTGETDLDALRARLLRCAVSPV